MGGWNEALSGNRAVNEYSDGRRNWCTWCLVEGSEAFFPERPPTAEKQAGVLCRVCLDDMAGAEHPSLLRLASMRNYALSVGQWKELRGAWGAVLDKLVGSGGTPLAESPTTSTAPSAPLKPKKKDSDPPPEPQSLASRLFPEWSTAREQALAELDPRKKHPVVALPGVEGDKREINAQLAMQAAGLDFPSKNICNPGDPGTGSKAREEYQNKLRAQLRNSSVLTKPGGGTASISGKDMLHNGDVTMGGGEASYALRREEMPLFLQSTYAAALRMGMGPDEADELIDHVLENNFVVAQPKSTVRKPKFDDQPFFVAVGEPDTNQSIGRAWENRRPKGELPHPATFVARGS